MYQSSGLSPILVFGKRRRKEKKKKKSGGGEEFYLLEIPKKAINNAVLFWNEFS